MKMKLRYRYLVFASAVDQPMLTIKVWQGTACIQTINAQLCLPDYSKSREYFVDMGIYQGEEVDIRLEVAKDYNPAGKYVLPGTAELEMLCETIRNEENAPADTAQLRPLIRYTPQCGWMNDPNGCIWHDGKYHLGYQFSPGTTTACWGINWGHAVSENLYDWTEQAPIIRTGGNSGGAWKRTDNGNLCICHGCGIFESDDGGYNYKSINAEMPYVGDPKVIWHEESQRYVMVAQRPEAHGFRDFNTLKFETSSDLIHWHHEGEISGFHECPDMFRCPDLVNGGERWVLTCGNGTYHIGDFDGHVFTPDPMPDDRLDKFPEAPFPDMYYMVYGDHTWSVPENGVKSHRGKAYTFQVFQNVPEGRCVRIGWMWVYFAAMGEGYNQCLTVPQDLYIKQTGIGVRMCAQPAGEIEQLYQNHAEEATCVVAKGKAFDCKLEMDITQIAHIGKYTFRYLASEKKLQVCPLNAPAFTILFIPLNDRIKIRSVWDIGSVEFFIGEGEVYLPLPTGDYYSEELHVSVEGDGDSNIETQSLRRAVYKH